MSALSLACLYLLSYASKLLKCCDYRNTVTPYSNIWLVLLLLVVTICYCPAMRRISNERCGAVRYGAVRRARVRPYPGPHRRTISVSGVNVIVLLF